MSEYNNLNHPKWECKYRIVFIPKCRRKVLYGKQGPCMNDVRKRQ